MENIVSPWFIYLLSVVNSIISLMIGTIMVSVMALIVYYTGIFYNNLEGYKDDNINWKKGWEKRIKLAWCIFILSTILVIFIPGKNTIIGMYVVNNVTYDRVGKVVEGGKLLKDVLKKDIIDIINEVNKKERK